MTPPLPPFFADSLDPNLLRGIKTVKDLQLIGHANVARLLLLGCWGRMHRKGTPLDQSFQFLLKLLPDELRRYDLGQFWEAMFEPGDNRDIAFRRLIASFTPTVPWLPRLRPDDYTSPLSKVGTPLTMLPWELEYFQRQSNDRLLRVFACSGDMGNDDYAAFLVRVYSGDIATLPLRK